jgi:hypothetical protein
MTGGMLVLFAAFGLAQPPAVPRPPTLTDLDRIAIDVLRDVHNRGAELYNRGYPAECYRMYEGALITVRPFLAHRPAVQKKLDDGLAEVAASPDGVKVQAFRLHELIEQVRADLKAEVKKAEAEKAEAKPPDQPQPAKPEPKDPPAAGTGQVKGVVTLDGQPVGGGEVFFVTLEQPLPRVFAAEVRDGAYSVAGEMPAGKYAVIVTGKSVPEKFRTTLTSGLRLDVAGGANDIDLRLTSKE